MRRIGAIRGKHQRRFLNTSVRSKNPVSRKMEKPKFGEICIEELSLRRINTDAYIDLFVPLFEERGNVLNFLSGTGYPNLFD
jgi:hypothetical protein